jgi:hypothetical protein
VAATIIAVHQLGRRTAIVRRAGNTLAAWRLLEHTDDLIEQTSGILDHLAQLIHPADRVALVALPEPAALGGHGTGYTDLRRAVLLGALLHDPLTRWAPLLVRPALYGCWVLSGYPAALVGPRERRGAGRLRLCRAAWDLAGAAMPDGPPTLATDQARLGELVSVTRQPVDWPGFRAVLRARCAVCGTTSPVHVRTDDPVDREDLDRERTRFTAQHVAWHLKASGRAGRLVVLDTAQAITTAAARSMTTAGIGAVTA